MATSVRSRNIIILCDGTGKNGEFDSQRDEPITNIWRLYNAIQPVDDDLVEYFPGVGAENAKATTSDVLARTFGHTAVHSIRKIYMTIARNYKDGDCVSLFGYSRGAFIVRKVASLLGALGLITDEAEFNKYWKSMEHKLPGKRNPPRPTNPRRVPISCLGVWDTVGAVRPLVIRETLDLLTLPDDDLPDIVESALHAVAYHENRKLFDVVLFDDKNKEKNVCKQTCFPGSHSDVGGGGIELKTERNVLPDVSLDWMLRNMPAAIRTIRPDLVSEVPATQRLSSAFHSSPAWKRIPDSLFRREYLPASDALHRHRTLHGLPAPDTPYLLSHDWVVDEDWDAVEEVPNVVPAKKSVIRRFTEMVRSSTRAAPAPVDIPPVPSMHPIPSTTEPEPLHRPGQFFRPDSASTQQTDATTDSADTNSTARTSVISIDLEPTAQGECQDEPEPESEPVPVPAVDKKEPVVEKVAPVVEKVEPEPIVETVPISEKPKSEPEMVTPVSNPRAKTKKGIIRRIKGFFRKTLCAGR